MGNNDGGGGSGFNSQGHEAIEEHSEELEVTDVDADVDVCAPAIGEKEQEEVVGSDHGKKKVAGSKKKLVNACPRPLKKHRSLNDVLGVQPTTNKGKDDTTSSKGKSLMTSSSKSKGPMTSSNTKNVATPTSKFMGSAIKAIVVASPTTLNKASQLKSASASVASSGQGDDGEDKSNIGKKTTSWVWEYFIKFEKIVSMDNGSTMEET